MDAPHVDPMLLVAELARRSGMCWVGYGDRRRDWAVWHVWHDDAVVLVTGGGEQDLPGLVEQTTAWVTLRAKSDRARLAACLTRVEVVHPGEPGWRSAAEALVAARQNLTDLAGVPQRWAAAGALVVRLVPSEVVQAPGSLPQESLVAEPVGSPASTRARGPWTLHRRQTQRRPLS